MAQKIIDKIESMWYGHFELSDTEGALDTLKDKLNEIIDVVNALDAKVNKAKYMDTSHGQSPP